MFGFLVAIVAGFVTPQLEEPLARPLVRKLGKVMTFEGAETRLIAFIMAMLVAGIVSALLESGSAFWVILGGALGYFGVRLVAVGREMLAARNNR